MKAGMALKGRSAVYHLPRLSLLLKMVHWHCINFQAHSIEHRPLLRLWIILKGLLSLTSIRDWSYLEKQNFFGCNELLGLHWEWQLSLRSFLWSCKWQWFWRSSYSNKVLTRMKNSSLLFHYSFAPQSDQWQCFCIR